MTEPEEVARYGILIKALKFSDGNTITKVETRSKNFTDEIVIPILENHLKFLKEKSYKKYIDSIQEFKENGV